ALTSSDVVAQTASQSFDISVWQFLSALLVGGSVRVFDTETATNGLRLFEMSRACGVTILEVVPSVLRSGLEQLRQCGSPSFQAASLRYLMLTGEALPPELARSWLERHPVPIINAYGPTECSDDVAHHVIHVAAQVDGAQVPFGRAIINTQLHVLDRAG